MFPDESLLSSIQDPSLDDFVRLAKEICQTPLAKIVFTDIERNWPKACIGFEKLDQNIGCCEYTIKALQFFEVPDTLKDKRFNASEWVISGPKIRYYAGMPFISQEGIALGTVCVMDFLPRLLTHEQQEALKALVRLIINHLELRGLWDAIQAESKTPQETEVALKHSNALLDATLESTQVGILVVDHSGKIVRYNQYFVKMWHIPKSIITSTDEQVISHMQGGLRDSGQLLEKLINPYCHPEEVSFDVFELENGTVLECSSYPQWIDDQSIGRVWSFQDTTEHHEQAALLRHRALHDGLTNLPNRVLFLDRLQQAILNGRRNKDRIAVLLMDLDGFKEVNDALGHKYGDILLQNVSSRVKGVLRVSDTLARFGGDEFAILLGGTKTGKDAERFARKILKKLEDPFLIDGVSLEVSASIGIALFPDHGEQVHTLVQKSDIAMSMAKSSGTNIMLYSGAQDQHSLKRLILKSDLRQAIQNEELFLLYQPKVHLESETVIGVEALVRWNHPEYGVIPPDQFISLSEQTGLIKPLTFWVLKTAMAQSKAWEREGIHLSVAVNLSVRSLRDLRLVDQIFDLIYRADFRPENLELEITESIIMDDPTRAMEIVTCLGEKGIKFALDDFGTGYSSMSYLKRLPIHSIKIDRSFIKDMLDETDNEVIVRSMIDLAHNLGINIIAEGVEDQETLDRLARIGCDEIQGYFFSPPISGDEMMHWASAWTKKHAVST